MPNVSNVNTTETNYPVRQKEQESSFVNSVMTQNGSSTQSTVEAQNTSKVDKLLEKLCAEFSKLGLNVNELKTKGILEKITNMSTQQIEKADDKTLERIYSALKEALKGFKNGNIDLDALACKANDYYTILAGGWKSVSEFKRSNASSHEDISARMERFFGLAKGSFINLPKEKIEEYLERYFNTFFQDKIKSCKNPNEIIRLQMRDFTKLLVNTPDEQKGIFREVVTHLLASNRLPGLQSVLQSFDSQTARTEWSDKWTAADTKSFAIRRDQQGEIPENDDVVAGIALITKNQSKEGIINLEKELQQDALKFFEENSEVLRLIEEKEAKGEPLTDSEKLILIICDNYIKSAKSGQLIGVAENTIIDKESQDELLSLINKDNFELPIYKEILEQVSKYLKEFENSLSLKVEELNEILDKATNGNYSIVASGSDQTLRAPGDTNTESYGSTTNSDGSFILTSPQIKEQAQEKIEDIRETILKNSEDSTQDFTVEPAKTTNPLNMAGMTSKDLTEGVRTGFFKSTTEAVLMALDQFSNLTESAREWVRGKMKCWAEAYVNYVLNKGVSGTTLIALVKDGIKIDEDKVSTDYNTRKALEHSLA